MGAAEGKSMLYLESRCVAVVRAAGSQGVQNGSISCVALVLSVPGGTRGDPRRERDRRVARSRGRVGERCDRVALRHPQDREADGPVPAGHRLRDLRLLGDAAPRQHVRRRQLRRRRPRRVADDPARLAGRRRHRARLRGGACWRRGARRLAVRAVFDDSGSRRSRMPRSRQRRPATTAATCRTATARRRRGGRRACSSAVSRVSTSRSPSIATASPTSPSRRRHAAAARLGRLPPDLVGDRRGRNGALGGQQPERLPGPGTGYRLEGARWELLQALPHLVDPRAARRAAGDARPIVETLGEAPAGSDGATSSSLSDPRSPTRSARRSTGSTTARCSPRSCEGCARSGADAAARAGPPRRRRRLHRPRRRAARRARASRSACSRRARR